MRALFFIVRREEPPITHNVAELCRMLREASFRLPRDIEEQLYISNK